MGIIYYDIMPYSLESTWISCIEPLSALNSVQFYVETATTSPSTMMAFLANGDPILDHLTMVDSPGIGDDTKVQVESHLPLHLPQFQWFSSVVLNPL